MIYKRDLWLKIFKISSKISDYRKISFDLNVFKVYFQVFKI